MEDMSRMQKKVEKVWPDMREANQVRADQCCAQCQRIEIKLKACAGCNYLWYCSKACQKVHWKAGHRQDCPHMALIRKRVILHSLQDTSKNGRQGEVLALLPASGRLSVLLDGLHEPLAIKPANVSLLGSPDTGTAASGHENSSG
jgi:hypothetical protein